MIAGELENMLYSNSYDHFLGKKKKAKAAKESKPKVSLGEKLQKVGQKIDAVGGAEGIGRTVDNVLGLFKKSEPEASTDYEFGLKKEEGSLPGSDTDEQKKKKKKLVTIGLLIAGGIIVLGGLAFLYSRRTAPTQ